MQRAGREASDRKERVGQGAAEQNLPAVRSQRERVPMSCRDRQGRARRSGIGCKFCLACLAFFDLWMMRLSDGCAMDQELFQCKPAIMRAFQAAKGVHKVIAGPCCIVGVCLPRCVRRDRPVECFHT
jgi:hypothetical protein